MQFPAFQGNAITDAYSCISLVVSNAAAVVFLLRWMQATCNFRPSKVDPYSCISLIASNAAAMVFFLRWVQVAESGEKRASSYRVLYFFMKKNKHGSP